MSRSNYTEDCDEDPLAYGRWLAQVKSAINGKRGQAFLREMLAALDAMPEKALIAEELEYEGEVCAIGAVGLARGIDMDSIDPEDPEEVANAFGIAYQMAAEIVYENDECGSVWDAEAKRSRGETPAERWARMRRWVVRHIRAQP